MKQEEIYTALTIILFIIFLLVVYYLRTKKSIEIKNSDLTVAFVPIFIILLFTGAIKEFDFLGIKGTFRDTFEDKISVKDIEKLPLTRLKEVPKGDTALISSLLPSNPEALTFIVGHQYFRNVIDEYINKIPSLTFILIKNESKEFTGLMEVSNYRSMNKKNEFINAIMNHNNNNNLLDEFSPILINFEAAMTIDKSKKDALDYFSNNTTSILPVVDVKDKTFKGIIKRDVLTSGLLKTIFEKID